MKCYAKFLCFFSSSWPDLSFSISRLACEVHVQPGQDHQDKHHRHTQHVRYTRYGDTVMYPVCYHHPHMHVLLHATMCYYHAHVVLLPCARCVTTMCTLCYYILAHVAEQTLALKHMLCWFSINEPHLPGLVLMLSHPLFRRCVSQCQMSSAMHGDTVCAGIPSFLYTTMIVIAIITMKCGKYTCMYTQ